MSLTAAVVPGRAYYLYIIPEAQRYKKKTILKKSGNQKKYPPMLKGQKFTPYLHPKTFLALLPQPAHRDFYEIEATNK